MKYYEWLCIPKVKAMSIFIVHILFFTFINPLSFHLIGRKTEEEGGNKETLYLSFHLSNSCKCWSWAKLKSATRNDATQNDTGVSLTVGMWYGLGRIWWFLFWSYGLSVMNVCIFLMIGRIFRYSWNRFCIILSPFLLNDSQNLIMVSLNQCCPKGLGNCLNFFNWLEYIMCPIFMFRYSFFCLNI